jgi:GH24 family phage-related lysozyme (muramidase)
MNISQNGLDLIKEFEGCRLSAYKDAVNITTIGWGTTNADKDITGTSIYMGMTISQATADSWLEKSVNKKYVPLVMKYDNIYHWNQNQLDGLTSFAYNIGSIDQLVQYGRRTISEISNAILYYDKAGGQTLAGLTRRRKAEKALFDTPCNSAKWIQDTIGWRYMKADGTFMKNEWVEYKDKWYFLKKNTYMAADEYVKSSNYETTNKLYYVAEDGAWDNNEYRLMRDEKGKWIASIGSGWYLKNSWANINGHWYYAGHDGYFYVNTTAKIDGKNYSFDGNGALKKNVISEGMTITTKK